MTSDLLLFYSPIAISFLSILSILLAYRVVQIRAKEGIGIGDGDNPKMERTIRVQANLLENMLPFSVLFVVYELNKGNEWVLIITGILFSVSRILHAQGLTSSPGRTFGRYYGTLFSWLVIVFLAVANIVQIF
jgi:uncharacterized membrane protein YecN with MAPEG domain